MKNSANYYLGKNRIKWLYIAGFFFLGTAFLLGIMLGSTPLSLEEIADVFH